MNYNALERPPLPGSTPAPGPQGKRTVYSTQIPPNFTEKRFSSSVPSSPALVSSPIVNEAEQSPLGFTDKFLSHTQPQQTSRQKSSQEKSLTKIIAKYPYEIRESVNAVLATAFRNSEHFQKDLELSHQEITSLRAELSKKTQQLSVVAKTCEIYKTRVEELENNIDLLEDNISSRKKTSLRNRSAVTRLATTNRMLIDALDALQTGKTSFAAKAMAGDRGGGGLPPPATNGRHLTTSAPAASESLSTMDNTHIADMPPRAGLLAPLNHHPTKQMDQSEYEENVQRLTMSQNDKLRESLLKIAREHYRSMKNAEHLEMKLNEMKIQMKNQEQMNRSLKSELDELKLIHNVDTSSQDERNPDGTNAYKSRSFGYIDEKFQGLIERNLFDPMEGLEQLRGILAHLAMSPNTLSLQEMIAHAVSRDSLKIFGADMICLYIVKPGQNHILHKFTTRACSEAQLIDMHESRSLAAETLKTGKVSRVNALSKSLVYNAQVDGCVGVTTRRILSIPLINPQHALVIGSIAFINKRGQEVFTEVDEVFGMIFAHQVSLLLTSCVMYDALFYHAQLLRGLLESSTELFGILPDPLSLSANKAISVGDVLQCLERVARDLLKCPDVKAFLCSNYLTMPPDLMVMLTDRGNTSRATSRRVGKGFPTQSVPMTSGIAGHVITTKQSYFLDAHQGDFDSFLNPSVDLDPLAQPMLTIPILDFTGNVLGCLQCIIGHRSPRLSQSDDPHDFRLLFPQAANWLTHQMAPPLRHLLANLDRSVYRPISTPSKISRASLEVHYRSSFFSNSEEVVNQMISVAESVGGWNAQESSKGVMPGTEAGDQKEIKPNASGMWSLGSEVVTIPEDEISHSPFSASKRQSTSSPQTQALQTQLTEKEQLIASLQESLQAQQTLAASQAKEIEELQTKQHDYLAKYQLYKKEKEHWHETQEKLTKQLQEEQEKVAILEQEKLTFVTQNQVYVQQVFDLEQQIHTLTHGQSNQSQEWLHQQQALQTQINQLTRQEQEHSVTIGKYEQQIHTLQTEQNQSKQELQHWQQEQDNWKAQQKAWEQERQEWMKKLQEKEQIQAILQEQVIQLANQKMQFLSEEVSKGQTQSSATATTSSPPVVANPSTPGNTTEEGGTGRVPVVREGKKPPVNTPPSLSPQTKPLSPSVASPTITPVKAAAAVSTPSVLTPQKEEVKEEAKEVVAETVLEETAATEATVATTIPSEPEAVVTSPPTEVSPRPSSPPAELPLPENHQSSLSIDATPAITAEDPTPEAPAAAAAAVSTPSKPSIPPSPNNKPPATPPPPSTPQPPATLSRPPSGTATPVSMRGNSAKFSTNGDKKIEWIEQQDEYGRKYYYNLITGVSSWEPPVNEKYLTYEEYLASIEQPPQVAGETNNNASAGVAAAGAGVENTPVNGSTIPSARSNSSQPLPRVMRGDWLQHFDEYGQEYWVNQITGRSEWTIPMDDLAALDSSNVGIAGGGGTIDEEDPDDIMMTRQSVGGAPSIFDTVGSHYSATAGDYTIEL